jgi:hypothetical protein
MNVTFELDRLIADFKAFNPAGGAHVEKLLESIFSDDQPASIEASDAIRGVMRHNGLSTMQRADQLAPIFKRFADALRVEH